MQSLRLKRAALILLLPAFLGAAARHPQTHAAPSTRMAELVLKHLQAVKDYQDLSMIYAEHRADADWLKSDEGKAVVDQLESLRADAAATKVVLAPGRTLQYSIGGKVFTAEGIAVADLDKSKAFRESMADAIAKNITTSIGAPAQAALAAFRGEGPKPVVPESPYESGLTAAKQKDWEHALEFFLTAQETDPYAPKVLFNLGLVSEKIPGRELRAMAWFQAYLLAAPDAPDASAVRAELARLETAFEPSNLTILDRIDEVLLVGKASIAQQAAAANDPKWGNAAGVLLAQGAEAVAAAHYFANDEAGALKLLHGIDTRLSPLMSASIQPAAMISAGLHVDAIVSGKQSDDYGQAASLDFLLEAGDLPRAWAYLKRWPANDKWILGVERFACTAHDRSDGAALDKSLQEARKTLARMDDTRGYHDLIRALYVMGEADRAGALVLDVPEKLQIKTLKRYDLRTAINELQDFNEGRVKSQGKCPASLSILQAAGTPQAPTFQWGEGEWGGESPAVLWWSTGRLAYLTDFARRGLSDSESPDIDARIPAYYKEISEKILAKPYEVGLWGGQLGWVEKNLWANYRRIRGPRPPSP